MKFSRLKTLFGFRRSLQFHLLQIDVVSEHVESRSGEGKDPQSEISESDAVSGYDEACDN